MGCMLLDEIAKWPEAERVGDLVRSDEEEMVVELPDAICNALADLLADIRRELTARFERVELEVSNDNAFGGD